MLDTLLQTFAAGYACIGSVYHGALTAVMNTRGAPQRRTKDGLMWRWVDTDATKDVLYTDGVDGSQGGDRG